MKAYKIQLYTNSTPHWSMGFSETVYFIPEKDIMLYSHSGSGGNTFGLSTDEIFLERVKKYVAGCIYGTIPKIDKEEVGAVFQVTTSAYSLNGYLTNQFHKTYRMSDASMIGPGIEMYGFEEINLKCSLDELEKIQDISLKIKDMEHDLKTAKEEQKTLMSKFIKL